MSLVIVKLIHLKRGNSAFRNELSIYVNCVCTVQMIVQHSGGIAQWVVKIKAQP